VDLSMEDVKQLLERLMFDGKIYKKLNPNFSSIVDDADYVPEAKKVRLEEEMYDLVDAEESLGDDDHAWVYMAMKDTSMKNVWTSMPCGNCSVFDFCADDGPVNPAGCEYFNKWLEF
jgi:DNA-directed RNA polymerase III subunit RPC6